MRRVSKTNSRKRVDEDYRHDYVDSIGFDEILFWTGYRLAPGGVERFWTGIVEEAHDPHHIFHIGQKRDYRTNLICIPRLSAHNPIHFGTKGEGTVGTLLCVYAKWLKQQKTHRADEFDLILLDECFGKSVLGWMEYTDFGPLNHVRDDFLKAIAKEDVSCRDS